MVQKCINLDFDIFGKLQKEENASGLIQELLKQHYSKENPEKATGIITDDIENLVKKRAELQDELEAKQTEQKKMKEIGLTPQEIEFFKINKFNTDLKILKENYSNAFKGDISIVDIIKKQNAARELDAKS